MSGSIGGSGSSAASAASASAPSPLSPSSSALSAYHGRWLLSQSSSGVAGASASAASHAAGSHSSGVSAAPAPAPVQFSSPSKSEVKGSWHSLALGLMRLQGAASAGFLMPSETAEWMVIAGHRHAERNCEELVWRFGSSAGGAEHATPLHLLLDGAPHVHQSPALFAASAASSVAHNTALTLTASPVPAAAAASHLSEGGSPVSLLLQIDLPPPPSRSKSKSFAEDQIARYRAGYILVQFLLPARGRLVQITEYHRAHASMKNDAVAAIEDAKEVPAVYAVTRVFQRVERKEEREQQQHSAAAASVPSTPQRQASTRAVSSAAATSSPQSARPALIIPPPSATELDSAAAVPSSSTMAAASPARMDSPTSASASSLSSAAAAASAAALPPIPFCTLTGVWKVDRSRSDTLEGMMKELNVAWLARKVILALEVLTHIKHEPAEHHCVVTDVSSAGEQATVHYTSGEVNEVRTKEGKTIKMVAKEGEEMRAQGVWPNLPPAMLHAPLSFPASEVPFTFPSYLPTPIAPDLKLHPLPYGYLWIHSFLPDIPGGEMQDVRLLLDRDSMVQQTMIIRNRKLVHTTTRYFNKVETAAEKARSEAEWEENCNRWKAAMAARTAAASGGHMRMGSRAGMVDTTSEDTSDDDSVLSSPGMNGHGGPTSSSSVHSSRSISRSSTGLTPIPPSPHLTQSPGPGAGMSSSIGGGPVPDLSGIWVVWKERSNDLGVLLKRMGVPWIYRAFANTLDIRTTITHTQRELVLKDTSKFGTHSQVFKLDGLWAPVVQYGNQRHGQCRVTSDPATMSVTVETVYFAANAGGKNKSSNRQAKADAAAASQPPVLEHTPSFDSRMGHGSGGGGGGAASASGSSAPPTPGLDQSLLTIESPLSPATHPPLSKLAVDGSSSSSVAASSGVEVDSENISVHPDGLLIEPLPTPSSLVDPSAPRSQSVEHSPRHHAAQQRQISDGATREARANSDPTARHLLLTEPPAAAAEEAVAAEDAAAESSSSSAAAAPAVVPALHVTTGDDSLHSRSSSSASSSLLSQTPAASLPGTPAHPTIRPPATPTPSASSTTSSASSSAFASPNVHAPSQGSLSITSRVIDIRCMLTPDLMRQVITYLEHEVVICVCSRYYKRELSAAEKKATRALEEQRKREEDQMRKQQQEEIKKRERDAAARRSSGRGGGGGGGSGSSISSPSGGPGAASYAAAAGAGATVAASSSSTAAAIPAAPVSVVLPTHLPPAVGSAHSSGSGSSGGAASASSSSSSSASGSGVSSLSLASITPQRALLGLLLSVAVLSGHRVLMLLVIVCVAAYAFVLHQQLQQQEQQKHAMATNHASASASAAAAYNALGAMQPAPSAVPPILPLGRGLQVEVVPLRRATNA